MSFSRILQRTMRIALVLTTGAVMQFDFSCTGVAERMANNINPCGTILNCDPEEYDLLTTDFPNWNLDPTCTIPGACGGPSYPLPSGGGGTSTPTTPTTPTTGT